MIVNEAHWIQMTTSTVEIMGTAIIVVGAFGTPGALLSFSLEVEMDGRWPWQNRRSDEGASRRTDQQR